MKYLSIDIETTGLNPDTCQILEFSAVYDNDQSIAIPDLPHFTVLVRHPLYQGEPYALQLNSRIFKLLADKNTVALHPNDFFDLFFNWCSLNDVKGPATIAGKNFGSFDLQFIKKLPGSERFTKDIRHRYIDVSNLFWNPSKDKESLPDLKECLTRAGEDHEVSHTAYDDACDVVALVRHHLKQCSYFNDLINGNGLNNVQL